MDTTADPCSNFFQYACGTWNKKHVIPEDRSSISTFEVLADQQQLILKSLLEEPISRRDDQGATIKAKKFYASCMDIRKYRWPVYKTFFTNFIIWNLQNKLGQSETNR